MRIRGERLRGDGQLLRGQAGERGEERRHGRAVLVDRASSSASGAVGGHGTIIPDAGASSPGAAGSRCAVVLLVIRAPDTGLAVAVRARDPERMDPHERRATVRRRVAAAIGAVLLAAAIALGIAGVVVYTGGSDLGLLLLVAALALLTAGAGLGVSAVRSAADRPR